MRKLPWETLVAIMVLVGLGVYFTWPQAAVEPARVEVRAEEEQESWDVSPAPVAEANARAPARMDAILNPARQLQDGSRPDVVEPIVVEDATPEPPAPQFGGLAIGEQTIRIVPVSPEQPMPYTRETVPPAWFSAELWEALSKFLEHPAKAETTEPPLAEEQSEPESIRRPQRPPAVDTHYHHHEMHCPYTGRCPLPVYPLPRPAAPDGK
jgi:hypothetical protein